MKDNRLAKLVHNYEGGLDAGGGLVRQLRQHIQRATRRYPHAYFELGRRDEESVDSLTHRVFTICAQVPKGRFPFRHRTPFCAYVEEEFEDPPIRQHTFYGRLSITREQMRNDYAKNIVRDPELRRRDALYRTLGDVLEAVASPVSQGPRPLWQLPADGPHPVRSPSEVARILDREGRASRSLEDLTRRALQLLGEPISQSRLAHILSDVTASGDGVVALDLPSTDIPDRLAVRTAIRRGWADLEDLDRSLVAGLARGHSADEMMAADPRLANRVAVTRAIQRIGKHFVQAIATDLGAPPDAKLTPRNLMEPILAVLVEILPQLEESHVQ